MSEIVLLNFFVSLAGIIFQTNLNKKHVVTTNY